MERQAERLVIVADAGNTEVTLGLWRGDDLVARSRLPAAKAAAEAEIARWVSVALAEHAPSAGRAIGAAVSSVTPEVTPPLVRTLEALTGRPPIVAGAATAVGVRVCVDQPDSIGADRVCNAVAAVAAVGAPVVVADFGTATTLTVVDGERRLIGGAIAPGLRLCAEALGRGAAQLPLIEPEPAKAPIGTNTADAMRAGLWFGAIGAAAELLRRTLGALGPAPILVTGGWSARVAPHLGMGVIVEPDLTLTGLRLMYEAAARPQPRA